jgi:hypothetical protein
MRSRSRPSHPPNQLRLSCTLSPSSSYFPIRVALRTDAGRRRDLPHSRRIRIYARIEGAIIRTARRSLALPNVLELSLLEIPMTHLVSQERERDLEESDRRVRARARKSKHRPRSSEGFREQAADPPGFRRSLNTNSRPLRRSVPAQTSSIFTHRCLI